MDTSKVKPEIFKAMQDKVNQLLSEANKQSDVAEHLGVNSGVISLIKNDDFTKIGEETFEKVRKKLNVSKTLWRDAPIRNLTLAVTMAKQTQENSHMAGLIGETGWGKTSSLSRLAAKEKDIFYCLADSEMTKMIFLKEICKALELQRYEGRDKNSLIKMIVKRLTQGDNPLLIIDDCGKLSDANVRIIQILYDRSEHECGILLAGMPNLMHGIEAKAVKDVKGFRELKRRIAYWEQLLPKSESDTKAVCEANEVTDESAIHYFHRECKDFGSLRTMILNAQKAAVKYNQPITAELLTKIHKNKIR